MTIAIGNRNTSDMVLFAEVVDAGTITAASHQVGLERSTVSRRMTSLEDRLGVPLLDRSSKVLQLTEAGSRYYEYCRRIVEAAEEADAVTRGMRIEPCGTLTVYASMSEVESFLSQVIEQFVACNKNVDVALSLHEGGRMKAEHIDGVGLCLDPITGGGLTLRRIADVGESVWASQEYLARHSVIEVPEDVRDHACITHLDHEGRLRWQFSKDGRNASISVDPKFCVQSLVSARQAALAGLGLAVLPNYLCREAQQRGALVRVLPDWAPPCGELMAVYPTAKFLSRNAKAFVEFTRHELAVGRFQELLT